MSDIFYSYAAVVDFVSKQRNIAPLEHPSAESVMPSCDLVYHFTDDEPQTPALGFRRVERESEDQWRLVYIDPSLQKLWKEIQGQQP